MNEELSPRDAIDKTIETLSALRADLAEKLWTAGYTELLLHRLKWLSMLREVNECLERAVQWRWQD